MVSKNQIKFIKSLHQKKYRFANNLFFAEGVKLVHEMLKSSFELHHLYTTKNEFNKVPLSNQSIISEDNLKKMSALTNPNTCLALFKIPKDKTIITTGLTLMLDGISDPGNLGTIIRLCDWFGINQIICSKDTVDVYSPKVLQASMGSIARVTINYIDLELYLSNTNLSVFGTYMDGKNIYANTLPQNGIIIMGNEANGISKNLEKWIQYKIGIPRFGNIQQTESLNVAAATAIILSEYRKSNTN